MEYIQVKAIRKGTKPPTWRRIFLPLGITFAQMAVILETALEIPLTDQYEFEFYQRRKRLIEWEKADNVKFDFFFLYYDAVKEAANDWFAGKTWFTFRVRGNEDGPQYRVEAEKYLEIDPVRDQEQPLFPFIMKEISYKGDPHWSDPNGLNEKLQEVCFLTEGTAEYPSFASVCERIGQGKGISCCQNIESIGDTGNSLVEKKIKENEEKIRQLQKQIEEAEKELSKVGLSAEDLGVSKLNREAPKPKRSSMETILLACTKEDLRFIAKECGAADLVKNRRSKAKIAYELARYLLEPGVMRKQMLELSENELDAFESAISRKRFIPTDEELDDLIGALDLCYAAEFSNGSVEVPEDAAAMYGIICKNGYRDFHRKARWLIDCLYTFVMLYAVGSVNILYKLYCQTDRFEVKREEFDSILAQIPETLNPCKKIGEKIVGNSAFRSEAYKWIEERQYDVPYYIPTEEEILDYSENFYPASDQWYRKLSDFLGRKLKINEMVREEICIKGFQTISTGGVLSDFMEIIHDKGIVFATTKQGEAFARLVVDLINHTRIYKLKGHMPVEMSRFMRDAPFSGRTKVIPMSSEAATMLGEARNEIGAMGFDVDLEESATDIPVMSMPNGVGGEVKSGTRKIYPNDPCPCGSGKKYKKCCGRGK